MIRDQAPAQYLRDTHVFPGSHALARLPAHFIPDLVQADMERASEDLNTETAADVYASFRQRREAEIMEMVRVACGVAAPEEPARPDIPEPAVTGIDTSAGDAAPKEEVGVADDLNPTPEAPLTVAETDLTDGFHQAMVDLYVRAKHEARYNATYFLDMVSNEGGLATARYLLDKGEASDGYVALWERQRLDLTVEAAVILPKWRPLFSDEEIQTARDRLAAYGFDVDAYLQSLG